MIKKIKYILLFIIFIGGSYLLIVDYQKNEASKKEENLLAEIKSHYNIYVKTNKEAKLYSFNNTIYSEIGIVSKDINLELEPLEINYDSIYFKIKNIPYYISYKDVEKTEPFTNDNYYKNYIVFNENVITNDKTTFYKNDQIIYQINESFSLPIIIKDIDKYYVEFNNELLYVKDIKEIINNDNTSIDVRSEIMTLAYHFIYKEGELCTNFIICHPYSQFEEHMKYLSDNHYFALTMKDLDLFIDGKIRIPKNSVVITLDDGYLYKNAKEILEKYKIHATYFVVTSWNNLEDMKSDYMYLASHTNNMHNNYVCDEGIQGSELLCQKKNLILDDLKISRTMLNNTEVFAYPFYEYNNRLIEILKEVGFKMAFTGYENKGYSNTETNKFKIPRVTVHSTTTMNEFKRLIE